MTEPLESTFFRAATPDGWRLSLKRVHAQAHLDRDAHPVAIIPGYGMNSSLFGYHPSGPSMEAFFAGRGFEVWSVDLRGQGGSEHPDGDPPYRLRDLAVTDLTAVFRTIAEQTQSRARGVHAVGCSLGGTLLFLHLAHAATDLVRSVVPMGAPLRWDQSLPLFRLLTLWPRLARWLPHRGLRRLAGIGFPLLRRVPWLLHAYLHPEISDTSDYRTLLGVVNDTSPLLNEEVALWLRDKELRIDGSLLSERLGHVECPLLCVLANADGIVPAEAALAAYQAWGGRDREILMVGSARLRFAHADLFISRYSQELVFAPIADWLRRHERSSG